MLSSHAFHGQIFVSFSNIAGSPHYSYDKQSQNYRAIHYLALITLVILDIYKYFQTLMKNLPISIY